jgi:Kiwa protein KwaB-like
MPVIEEINMSAAATLVVAWRTGRNAHAATLKSGGQVIEALRTNATKSLELIASSSERPYNPDDEQDDDSPVLSANHDELLDTALLEQIQIGSSLPLISPEELSKRTIALYALLVGNDPDSRIIFVRRGNPVSLAAKSVVAIFDQTLTRVTQPILAFDSNFDVILHGSAVWILNQKNFEALFKESEAVLAHTSEWVDQLNTVLPIADDGKKWLSTRLRQNSIMRRKVQSILRSPYLSSLTAEALSRKMLEHGLTPETLIKDGTLIFNKDTEKDMLLFLNEDLWTGDFSGEQYAATKKARR